MNGKLQTTVYSKPTDAHLYLHSKSCHPKKLLLRLKRICSTDEEFHKNSIEYSDYLVNRGHSKSSINRAFEKVSNLTRTEARIPKRKANGNIPIIFTTKFDPSGPSIKNIVSDNLHILDDDLRDQVLVAFKRENNLKELLLRADPYQNKSDLLDRTPHGYKACNKTCDSCKNFVVETTTIKSNATGRIFHIRRDCNCESKNVIYVASCLTCGKQGVGSTTKWKPCLRNYKSHIRNRRPTCCIVKHFMDQCVDESLSNLKFTIVDVLNNVDLLNETEIDDILLQKEKFWIGTLVTQHQEMNSKHDWNRKCRTEREKF